MRVLVLNWLDWTHPLWGGAEVYLREVSRRLVDRGHEVTVLCSVYAGGVANETLDGVHVARRGRFWTYGLELPWHYRRLVRERGAWDVVLEYTCKVPLFAPVWAGAPVVAVAHHLWGRAIFAESPLPVAAAVWASEALLPVVYRKVPWLAVSPSTRDDLVSRGIPAASITLAPNGIELPAPGSAIGTPDPHTPRVVWVGRARRYKRLDLLVRAMVTVRQAVPHATLDVVGDGPALGEARQLAERLGLGPAVVTFHGAVTDEERNRLVGRAWVLAQPSLKEGWGRTVLEAGAFGVPSVVADVPGLRDAVEDGMSGRSVAGDNPVHFGAVLISLLNDRVVQRRLGIGARTTANAHDWSVPVDATKSVMCAYLARGRQASQRQVNGFAVSPPGFQG
jgi:glycosyltransferase involved in cell wall biosynthesis